MTDLHEKIHSPLTSTDDILKELILLFVYLRFFTRVLAFTLSSHSWLRWSARPDAPGSKQLIGTFSNSHEGRIRSLYLLKPSAIGDALAMLAVGAKIK